MGLLTEQGFEIVKALVPPRTNDLDEQQRWRWVVFATLVALSVAFCSHIALECGWLPSVHPGFALASDVKSIEKEIHLIYTSSLERDITDKVRQHCKARDPDLRRELQDDIDRLQKDYKAVSGDWFHMPKCEDL